MMHKMSTHRKVSIRQERKRWSQRGNSGSLYRNCSKSGGRRAEMGLTIHGACCGSGLNHSGERGQKTTTHRPPTGPRVVGESQNIVRRHLVEPAQSQQMVDGQLIGAAFIGGVHTLGSVQPTGHIFLGAVMIFPQIADAFDVAQAILLQFQSQSSNDGGPFVNGPYELVLKGDA